MKRFYNYGKASVTITPAEPTSFETLFDEVKDVIDSANPAYEVDYVAFTWDKINTHKANAFVRFCAKEMFSKGAEPLHPDTE